MEQKKKKPIDIPSLIYGKVPPHSKELEETVLGVMMDYPETIGIVKPLLNDNDFYVNANQIIFKAIYDFGFRKLDKILSNKAFDKAEIRHLKS